MWLVTANQSALFQHSIATLKLVYDINSRLRENVDQPDKRVTDDCTATSRSALTDRTDPRSSTRRRSASSSRSGWRPRRGSSTCTRRCRPARASSRPRLKKEKKLDHFQTNQTIIFPFLFLFDKCMITVSIGVSKQLPVFLPKIGGQSLGKYSCLPFPIS